MITESADLYERAHARLLQQLKDSPKLAALLANYVAQLQTLEGVLFDILATRSIETATDAQLDQIGEVVGEDRNGLTDAAYRIRLRARIAINLASGTPNEVLDIMRQVLGAEGQVTEYPPLAYVYHAGVVIAEADAASYAKILESITPVCVNAQFVCETGASIQFDDANSGFDDTALGQGGVVEG